MCNLTTHICQLCGHTTHLPILTRCPTLQHPIPLPCTGSVSVRSIKYHKGEYCIFCYHTALREIEKKYQKEIEGLYVAEEGEKGKGLEGRQWRRREKLERDRKWELDELSREWLDRQVVEG